MSDTTIGVDPAEGDASAAEAGTDDATATVWVPEADGWRKYRLTPNSRLVVDGPDGQPRAIIETDPDSTTNE